MNPEIDYSKSTGFFGLWRGIVKDNTDPERLRRVRIQAMPMMEGITDKDSFPWAVSKDPRTIDIPEINSVVWVEFESGDIMKPVYSGYVCDQYGLTIPPEAQSGYPFTKVFKLKTSTATVLIKIDKQGNITVSTKGKQITLDCEKIYLSAKKISLGQNTGYIVTCPDPGKVLEDGNGYPMRSSKTVKA